jgi:8-oxo-dGTP pyrophosphatase MutT (NUDIX family)
MSLEEQAQIAVPRPAATLVLLRESNRGLEALLLQRLARMAFAGGEWVFPGGAVDATDDSECVLQCTPKGTGLSTQELSWRVAACRETFEESGVLLARYRQPQGACRPLTAIARADGAFGDLLRANDLLLSVDQLVLWANWITPSYAPRRFDTHFFAAAMPEDQQVRFDASEAQAARWVSVADPGIELPGIVATPAMFTLREIARRYRECGSLAGVLASASTAARASIMLKLLRNPESLIGLLPWDPAYADAPGEGTACSAAMAQRFLDFPARFELDPATGAPRGL